MQIIINLFLHFDFRVKIICKQKFPIIWLDFSYIHYLYIINKFYVYVYRREQRKLIIYTYI